ncbi:hypothetical protein, partial [Salmonella enterica]|uniref:hypothetical protein n=1 Tax=Salmonella enterica TaxID=28901 RepID=UPI003D29412D
RLLPVVLAPLGAVGWALLLLEPRRLRPRATRSGAGGERFEQVWQALVVLAVLAALVLLARYVMRSLTLSDIVTALGLGCLTMLR